MTKQLDEAIATLRALPEDEQRQAAEVLFAVLQSQRDAPDLSDDDVERVRQSQEAVRAGDIATEAEIEEVWRRFGLA